MNKKFSTLVASLLLAGAFCFDASATKGDKISALSKIADGQIVYLQSNISKWIGGNSKDAAEAQVDKNGNNTYYQWVVSKSKLNGKDVYSFTNVATSAKLSVSGSTSFTWATASGTSTLTSVTSSTATKEATPYTAKSDEVIANPTASTSQYATTIEDINNQNGYQKGFTVDFFEVKDNEHVSLAVEANPFSSAAIKAYKAFSVGTVNPDANAMLLKVSGDWDGAAVGTKTDAEKSALAKFRASKFIVLDKEVYSAFATNVDGTTKGKGYKFVTVSGAELLNLQGENDYNAEKTSVTHPVTNAWFNVAVNPNHSTDIQLYVVNPTLATKNEFDKSAWTGKAYVSVFNFEGKNYIGSNNGAQSVETHICFTNGSIVAQKTLVGQIVNIEYVGDKAGQAWDAKGEDVATSYIDKAIPEGQWIIGKSGNGFKFTNRESATEKDGYTLYTTATANVYTAKNSKGVVTLKITEAPARETIFDNYENLDENGLLDNTYNISVSTELFDKVYLAETGLAKTVELTSEADKAGAWKLTKYYADKNYEAGIEVADTIYHINTIDFWNKNKQGGAGWDQKADTLAMFAYTIQNEAGNYLAYNDTKKAYEVKAAADLTPANATFSAREHAPKFIFKEKQGKVNILALVNNDFKSATDKKWAISTDATTNYADKLFGAFSYNKVDEEGDIYKVVDNDLFAVEAVSTPEYRRLAGMDTVKIFKDENQNDLLFEKGSFLGMEHLSDFANMAPAMFVDTAYVRYDTRKPQYLLVVAPNQVIDKEECDIPNHPHAQADTLYGRFLVNLVDSAKAYAAQENKLSNPYMWEGGYKLGFRAGKHTGDKLIMDAAKPAASDTIDLSKNVNKIGTYAFRYVDRTTESFIIETSLDGSSKPGYIKWLNGTPVVISDVTKAEVFNLAKTEEQPTANDEVSAEAGVSVVATNGAVIIKNAAGKQVAISNILGKSIANTTLASDNETIAVPAGIVVIAVEGEEAVKAVVK